MANAKPRAIKGNKPRATKWKIPNKAERKNKSAIPLADRLLDMSEVVALTGIGHSTIFRMVSTRKFPPGLKLSPGMVRWRGADVLAWIESRPPAVEESAAA